MDWRIVEIFYKARPPRIFKICPALRSGRQGLLVLGQTKLTNMPAKSTEKTMEKENSMKETLPKSTQKKSQTTTYLSEDFHARRLVSQENAEDLTIQEALSFLKSHESVVQKSPDLYYLKTSKAYLATTLEKLSRQSLKFSPTSGIFYNGKFSIVKTSECRRIGKECSLSDILEEHPGQKYFLSQEKVKTMVLGLKAE